MNKKITKILSIAMTATLYLSPLTVGVVSAAEPKASFQPHPYIQRVYGDADLEGNININDATYMQKYLVKMLDEDINNIPNEGYNSNNLFMELADVDMNGVLNINDITLVQKHLANVQVEGSEVGKEFSPKSKPSDNNQINKIIDVARKEIGTTATDFKNCKYNNDFYGYNISGTFYDWCSVFMWWVFETAGHDDLLNIKTASCGQLSLAFYNKNSLYTSDYKVGDVALFRWTDDMSPLVPGIYKPFHVGIIESVNPDGTYTTIEGNVTDRDDPSFSPNGEVRRMTRYNDEISCVCRPNYDTSNAIAPDITYSVKTKYHGWLLPVNNLEDYAGIDFDPITAITIKASSGTVRYQVHIKGGDWLDEVTGYSTTDSTQYCGNGKEIDAIRVYYENSDEAVEKGEVFRAKYRVSPVGTTSYLDDQYNAETENEQLGYVGEFGKPLDKFQIFLTK